MAQSFCPFYTQSESYCKTDKTISTVSAHFSDSSNRQSAIDFNVGAINDCIILVKLLEKYPLRAKKQHDFTIWKQAVEEINKPIDCRNTDLLEYYYLKIQEIRQYKKQDELVRPKIKSLQLVIEFE